MSLFGLPTDQAIHLRLDRIERQLQTLLDHFQLEFDDGFGEVRRLAAAGEKIEAIKLS